MASDRGKLGTFLNEVIHWQWNEFCVAEKDSKYTGVQAAVFSLIRTCSNGKLGAIKLAIDRVDGKLETPVKIEYPKIWLLFPYAEKVALPTNAQGETPPKLPAADTYSLTRHGVAEPKEESKTLPTLTLRETVNKMADAPKDVVRLILAMKRKVELQVAKNETIETDSDEVAKKVPLVKSVIAAHLLNLAIEENNFEAITEVFEQIDGKLVETIKVLGDDVYLTQYALEAPAGSVKNSDGVYMIKATDIEAQWAAKLALKNS